MFYNLSAIVIGLLLFFSAYSFYKAKTSNLMIVTSLICASGFLSSGIVGFMVPDNLSYIVILIMLVFSIIYLVAYIIFKKRLKRQEVEKENGK